MEEVLAQFDEFGLSDEPISRDWLRMIHGKHFDDGCIDSIVNAISANKGGDIKFREYMQWMFTGEMTADGSNPGTKHHMEKEEPWLPLPPDDYQGAYKDRGRYKFNTSLDDLALCIHSAEKWKAAFCAAGDGTPSADMNVIKPLRKLIWLQTEQAIKHSLAGNLWPGTLQADPVSRTIVFSPSPVSTSEPIVAGKKTTGVMQMDMLVAAGEFARKGHQVAVLNMAAARAPGGGFREGAGAQEENQHRRTDLYRFTLMQQDGNYPIPRRGCLISEGVTIMRGTEKEGYPFLAPDSMQKVSIVSCAALSHPRLNGSWDDYASDDDRETMKAKAAAVLQAAAHAKCDVVVLSAFGCGAFCNPPHVVANIFYEALQASSVENAVFCIFDDHNAGRRHNPRGNYEPFKDIFGEMSEIV